MRIVNYYAIVLGEREYVLVRRWLGGSNECTIHSAKRILCSLLLFPREEPKVHFVLCIG
jgi:hypothetical protein